MKTKLFSLFVLSVFLFSCSSNSNKQEESQPVNNPAPVVTSPPVPAHDTDGTSVHINNEGVSIKNKDDGNQSDIKIGSDSVNIDISKKKKPN